MALDECGPARGLAWSESGHGWLYAVALGLQKRSRVCVFQALLPIALGARAGDWIDCLRGLFSGDCHSDEVVAVRGCGNSPRRGDLEALADPAPDLGGDAGKFLGP